MTAQKVFYVAQVRAWYKARAASVSNQATATLDAGQVLDGVTLAQGDIVLLKDQTTATQNGLYLINADGSAATRWSTQPAGFNTSGTVVKVHEGTVNANSAWLQYAEPGVAGTDALKYIDHPTA